MIYVSIVTDPVSNELKEAIVTPIYEEGDKLNVRNYRSVSMLCILSNIPKGEFTFTLYNTEKEMIMYIPVRL